MTSVRSVFIEEFEGSRGDIWGVGLEEKKIGCWEFSSRIWRWVEKYFLAADVKTRGAGAKRLFAHGRLWSSGETEKQSSKNLLSQPFLFLDQFSF